MTGDQSDIAARLKRLLPNWFGQDAGPTPVLDALLEGPAWALAFVYGLIAYAKLQTRIRTMTDGWLDMAAEDFFGDELRRKASEGDDVYRARIRSAFFAPSNTRVAISEAVQAVSGAAPRIIEPWNPRQTGAFGRSYLGVDTPTCPGRVASGLAGEFYLEVAVPPQSIIGWGTFPIFGKSYFGKTYFVGYSAAQQAIAGQVIQTVRKLKAEGVLARVGFTGLVGTGYAPRWDVPGYAWDTGAPPRWDVLPHA